MALELTPWGYVDRDTPPPFESLSNSIRPVTMPPISPLKPQAVYRERRRKPEDVEAEIRLMAIEDSIGRLESSQAAAEPGPTAAPQIGGV